MPPSRGGSCSSEFNCFQKLTHLLLSNHSTSKAPAWHLLEAQHESLGPSARDIDNGMQNSSSLMEVVGCLPLTVCFPDGE